MQFAEGRFMLLSELKTGKKAVGINQCRKAVTEGKASVVFFAEDAEQRLKLSLIELCASSGVKTETVPTMKELGLACGIEVGASAAVLLK